jgi:hypothetical protein
MPAQAQRRVISGEEIVTSVRSTVQSKPESINSARSVINFQMIHGFDNCVRLLTWPSICFSGGGWAQRDQPPRLCSCIHWTIIMQSKLFVLPMKDSNSASGLLYQERFPQVHCLG